ncbi:MAG: Glycosyl transferase family 11, partial [Parcubacteria group bacterium GW2011_GWC1_40_13]
NTNNPTFFVFSDEMDYVRKNLYFPENTHFVSNSNIKDYEELVLMSKCSHNIIANSSFSWWGAWLNQNPNKIVIAPKIWRADGKSIADYVPKELNWIRI